MTASRAVALLGGTFDPVHIGHVGLADDAQRAIRSADVRLVPAADPPHRPPPGASAAHRLAMLKLAVDRHEGLDIDTREIARGGKSYTVLTLEELRAEAPTRPLILVLGADAFRGLPTWRRWEDIPKLAHIAVAARPGDPFHTALPDALLPYWSARRTSAPSDLIGAPAGRIYVLPSVARDVSASAIRAALKRGGEELKAVRSLLPPAVWDYIDSQRLYAG